MPYVKPGVEIQQVERSQSPVLITPELEATILGTPYFYQSPYSDDSKCAAKLVIDAADTDGTDATFDITTVGAAAATSEDGNAIVEASIVVDLVCTKGANIGRRFHADAADFSITTTVITVSQTADGVAYDTSVVFADEDEFDVYVGFIAEKAGGMGHSLMTSISDITEYIGAPKTFNPLGYGAMVAMLNAGSQVNTFGHVGSEDSYEHVNDLEMKDTYAIAGMCGDDYTTSIPAWKTHVEAQSLPTAKHERIVFVNPEDTTNIVDGLTSSTRATGAAAIQQANAAVSSKRVFSIHPDRGYVLESRHVSTLKSAWIVGSFASSVTGTIATGVHDLPKTASQIITTDGTKYPAGTTITATIWNALVADGWGEQSEVSAYVPVPGYYYSAAAAGAAIGTLVQQPLTYYALGGVSETYGGLDMFTETNLNTMAEGGTMVVVQNTPSSPIYVRHQLSTDVTTIERKELSITKQVDYAAKYMRKTLVKYAGKYNITPKFLKLVEANLNGVGADLVRDGKVANVEVVTVYQDDISPDTVRAEVILTVKYPANYIKVRLIV
jgi:hypothetical protein